MQIKLRRPYGRKGTLLLIVTLLATETTLAQLKINDTCPNVTLKEVINYPNQKIELSDFKSKAIIIDFWNTRCLSCLQSFPVIDSLQKKFKDDVQFLFVTKEDEKTVKDFFTKHKKIKIPLTPMVVGDKILSRLFPSEGFPYTAWMDSQRVVKYLTGGYNTTELHLKKFLKGENQNLKYSAVQTKYLPLWSLDGATLEKKMVYYSSLTSCIHGVDISSAEASSINNGHSIQISCNCCTIPELLRKAFSEMGRYSVYTNYGMEFQLKDKANLFPPADKNAWDEWQEHNAYNYTLVVPADQKKELYKMMQQDLIRYLNISVTLERKKIKGYELVVLKNKKLNPSKSTKKKDPYDDETINGLEKLEFTNQTIERLVYLLKQWMGYYYPVGNTIQQNFGIDFTVRKSSIESLNIEELREDLKKTNLDLKQVWIEEDIWVVRDK